MVIPCACRLFLYALRITNSHHGFTHPPLTPSTLGEGLQDHLAPTPRCGYVRLSSMLVEVSWTQGGMLPWYVITIRACGVKTMVALDLGEWGILQWCSMTSGCHRTKMCPTQPRISIRRLGCHFASSVPLFCLVSGVGWSPRGLCLLPVGF
jgi:hypothetical protein